MPAFAAEQKNPFGITIPTLEFTAPEFSDVDGDGDLDMMTGEYDGNFIYYKNTGTKSSPAFAAPATNPFGLTKIATDYSFVSFGWRILWRSSLFRKRFGYRCRRVCA